MKAGFIMLGTRDLERSVAFYRDQLGLGVLHTSGDLAFLNAGSITLCVRVFSDLGTVGDERRTEIVFTVDDIDAEFARLHSRGVVFAREPRIVTADKLAADFRDPDGHVLSIFGPRLARQGAL